MRIAACPAGFRSGDHRSAIAATNRITSQSRRLTAMRLVVSVTHATKCANRSRRTQSRAAGKPGETLEIVSTKEK
jgi:hypothetical protein